MSFLGLKPISRILCLGAHSDDIEIGCGGTIRRLVAEHPGLAVDWIVFSADDAREAEARASAGQFIEGAAGATVEVHRFRDGFFPNDGDRIKQYFEELKRRATPDLVFTHYRSDLHQDHRVISDLTWNTFRKHFILEYEIPKWDGDMGSPNFFVHLTDENCHFKIATLLDAFASQRGKHWFSDELFKGVMRIRGMESNSPSGYAEGFYARKASL